MKTIKWIVAVAFCAALLSSCKSKECPGYGEAQQSEQQVEQYA
ncbi:MAG: hypothetical protein U0L74_00140 [Paludibacteraceae bacterium]|jgi:predicted small secreted protein|nr:hypothetical protein [Paludibacteraceae bacterium]